MISSNISVLEDNASAADKAETPDPNVEAFSQAVISAAGLAQLEIDPREPLAGNWFREGDLGFIYGKRGLGKTWFSLGLAQALSTGKDLGNWQVRQSRVLYVDGEMPLEAIKDRNAGLGLQENSELLFLNHESFYESINKPLSLSAPDQMKLLADYCETNDIRVLFLDNLSCLFSGMRENDADDWEKVLPWLLNLRRKKIAVVIIHHSGRAGTHMRGTSRREDAAFWCVGLSDSIKGRGERKDGARFLTRFTKDRNSVNGDETSPLDWHFKTGKDGSTQVHISPADTVEIILQLIEDGLDSCSAIAEEIGMSKGSVSKNAKKLERNGAIEIRHGKYRMKPGRSGGNG